MTKKIIFPSFPRRIWLPILIGATIITAGLSAANLAVAADSLVTLPENNSGCPAEYDGNCGNYSIDDAVRMAINASRLVLGLIGSLALVMFIYGGVMFLISAGSSESVGKAKKIITAAIIGLIIVFTSFLIIKFILGTMGITWNGGKLETSKTAPARDSTQLNTVSE